MIRLARKRAATDRHAAPPCPALGAGRRAEAAVFRHIVLATDLTAASERAHETAASLATAFGARLTAVHVCETPTFAAAGSSLTGADLVGPCGDGGEAELGRLVWRLRGKAIRAEGVLRYGVAWEHIVRVAREVGADLVVTGTHGRHGIAHAYFGSVAEKVVQESPVPVLAVPQHA
jgi:nucleotide-binding universal stress UspA family protein